MGKEKNGGMVSVSASAADLQRQKMEWRRKGWSIPDIRGGKQLWFSTVCRLVELVGDGQACDLDAVPDLGGITGQAQPWRFYASFLKSMGLVSNQAGMLCLSEEGELFRAEPGKGRLADLLQDKIRLFGEVLKLLAEEPATVEEVHQRICEAYGLTWNHVHNTRRRMDWLEVLELIRDVGNRKWEATLAGKEALREWSLVSPEAMEAVSGEQEEPKIGEPPEEIAVLLRRLEDCPELHRKRSTYNIWAPSPNQIDNLRMITQASVERITRADLFRFIEEKFNLKTSSVKSMVPFLKASGLMEEVGRSVYLATPAAKAWLETGDDLDFIRIIHANMRFVGELIRAAQEDVTRRELYEQAKSYGLNEEKTRWIAGFLREAGLLEDTQYLHLKATPMGIKFISGLPLETVGEAGGEDAYALQGQAEATGISGEASMGKLEQITEKLRRSARDPLAEGKSSGVAFEEAIAELFRFMGFEAKRIGGAGDTDVVVRWQDEEGRRITAILDGKSKSCGQVYHNDVSDVAIHTHKEKHNADFAAIIGPGFGGDTTIRDYARKNGFALITDAQLTELARASQDLGLGLEEIALVFQVPDGMEQMEKLKASKQRELELISTVVSRFSKEQEQLGSLSPRDLFLLLHGMGEAPSLKELLQLFELLSSPEIGILRVMEKDRAPENTTYLLRGAKETANRLRAVAAAIEKGTAEI